MSTLIVPFVGGSYQARSKGISTQRSLNLYPENVESVDGKSKQVLVHTEGTELVANIGVVDNAFCRGFWYSSTGPDNRSLLYGAFGNKVYRINPNYSFVEIGDIQSGTGSIGISDNGFDLVIADGVALYKADLLAEDNIIKSTYTQVSLPQFSDGTPVAPSQVWFLNQRFIINSQRGQFYYSNLASTIFDATNFYTAESSADTISALAVVSNRLWVFGERSYEVWNATGVIDDDPLTFLQGSASQIGIQAPKSLATISDFVFFLGGSDAGRNSVFISKGLQEPQRVSTDALENQIGKIGDKQGAIGWCYYNEGHTFYVLTFRDANKTFVYDVDTQLWHERSTRNWVTTEDESWEALYGVSAYNEVLHGSVRSNRLLKLDPNKYTDYDGREIIRERVSPVYFADYNIVTCREFYVDMEVGTTPLLEGLGRDPQAVLDISRDGGYTWVNYDWRSIGKQGDYLTSVKWTNLGSGRSLVIRLRFSDPSPITIYGARLTIQESSTR